MKSVFLSVLLLASAAQAASPTVLVGTATVNFHDLSCLLNAGYSAESDLQKRMVTYIGVGPNSSGLMFLQDPSQKIVKMKHTVASAQGCDVSAVDKIANAASSHFGFAYDVPIEATTEESDPFISSGRCIVRVDERLKIDLGSGVVLNSAAVEFRGAQGCK